MMITRVSHESSLDSISDFDYEDIDVDDTFTVVTSRKPSPPHFPTSKQSSTGSKRRKTIFYNKCMKVSAVDPGTKLGNINPVYISKAIAGAFGPQSVQPVTKCRDGGLFIIACDDSQDRKLCTLRTLGIPVSAPAGLRGIISDVPLGTPDKSILACLDDYRVIHTQRITNKIGGQDSSTLSVKLAFSRKELQKYINLGSVFLVSIFLPFFATLSWKTEMCQMWLGPSYI